MEDVNSWLRGTLEFNENWTLGNMYKIIGLLLTQICLSRRFIIQMFSYIICRYLMNNDIDIYF